jgi:HEAT repeat protein
MALANINSVLEQIDELIRHATDHDDMEFRLRLEALVKKGGRDTENAIALYITGTRISIATCLNLIRMAGYIRSSAFLLPLNTVIEMSGNNEMREAAIISVSKYNDHRALDILVRAMEKIKNKHMQETITRAIARIKNNNPLLALLPRFLHGSKDRELFQITLKIFKKILGPADAKTFIAYLHHGDQVVAEGAFEILCFRGDEAVFFFIAEFFRERSRLLVRETEQETGGERFALLIAALHEYLKRFNDFIPQLRPDIAALLGRAGGCGWGKALAAMLADLEKNCGAPG